MKLKHIPINLLVRAGFKVPYWVTLPLEMLRYGSFYKRSPKPPAFSLKKEYYRYLSEEILGASTPIHYLEFGVFRGNSIRYWSQSNQHPDSRFYGFDSFEGLPDNWEHFHRIYSTEHFNLKGKTPDIDDSRVSFIKGYFQDTLTEWMQSHVAKLNDQRLVIHCDADMYSSTLYVLTRLHDHLIPGTLILFDEFYSVADEYRAWMDYCQSYNVQYKPVASVSPCFQRLAVEIIDGKTESENFENRKSESDNGKL